MSRHPIEPPADGSGNPGDAASSGSSASSASSGDAGGSAGFDPEHALDHPIVVPDDARELDRDVQAWRREERWRRRQRRIERLFLTRRWRERGISGPAIALVLVLVASIGAMISIMAPGAAHSPTRPVPLRLAAPSASAGTTHGLLPDTSLSQPAGLSASNTVIASRTLRPGVVAILGPGCDCAAALATLAREASADALPVYLVGSPAQSDQLGELVDATSRDVVEALVDNTGALIDAYQPHGLTVVPVHADGVTEAAVRDFSGHPAITDELRDLKQAGPAA
ncbi:MAG: hypothetical protein ACRDV3_03660 [Acidothermaceae bacterium]